MLKDFKQSLIVSAWFVFLTFPLMAVRVNTAEQVVEWRFINLIWVAYETFAMSYFWRFLLARRGKKKGEALSDSSLWELVRKDSFVQNCFIVFLLILVQICPAIFYSWVKEWLILFAVSLVFVLFAIILRKLQFRTKKTGNNGNLHMLMEDMSFRYKSMSVLLVFAMAFPLVFDSYQVNIMNLALIYVVLGLGLNISVGLAGLLDLGYIAFFGVGAYSYGLLNHYFDLGFWTILPVGGILSCLFGVVLGFPILRLRGDYLAIVTLGFGMIFQIVLQNWSDFTMGMAGISKIAGPGLFGFDMNITGSITYIYYIMIGLVVFTILITMRLRNSRVGRAWIALREDEIACVAMGIDMARTKLSAYALGAFWAGMIGVLFAAKQAFINPASFGFMESAIVLSIVVLGGMGSILGVILGAFILILMPEYLRAFSEYRMLAFGAAMVLMMIFRPQGLISNIRQKYEYKGNDLQEEIENG